MTPKKAPPIVYHSNQLKGLNGVDDIQDKYLYNAAIKMDEQIEHFITPVIERLTGILHELKKVEHGEKQTAALITELFSQLVDGSVLEGMKWNKKLKISQKFEVYNAFAESSKFVQLFHNAFINAQKIIAEYWMNADLLLLLSTKIAYSLFSQCKNIVGLNVLPRLSNAPSSSHSIDVSLGDEDLRLAINSILDYCLNFWKMKKSFSKMFVEKLETQRLNLCDTNMRIVLHHRKKHLKSGKTGLKEIKCVSLEDSRELYLLATDVKKAGQNVPVRISSLEIEKIQHGIKNLRVLCDEKRISIDTGLQANKEAITKNAELEFFEKENRRRDVVLNSSLYASQLLLFPKFELERLYWRDTLSRQLQMSKCSVYQAYLKNADFRKQMITILDKFPQICSQGRIAVENSTAYRNKLIAQIARRKASVFQSTPRCRNQWSQHYDVAKLALNEAGVLEDDGLLVKRKISEKIQNELDEVERLCEISMTISFNLPARLVPPFPQNEARLLPDPLVRYIDISPCRPSSAKLAVSPAVAAAAKIDVKEVQSDVAVSERSKRNEKLFVASSEAIEGCTSSGIRYTIRNEKSSEKGSRKTSPEERQQRKRKRSETPENYRDDRRKRANYYRDNESPREERRGRISEMYERDYGRYDKDSSDRRDYRRQEKDSDRRERDYDRRERNSDRRDYDKRGDNNDYSRSSRSDDRYGRDYDDRGRHNDRYGKDYGRFEKDSDRHNSDRRDYDRRGDNDRYEKDYRRHERESDRHHDRDSSRCSSSLSHRRKRRDSDDSQRRSRRVTPERDVSPKPCDVPINISSEMELEPISISDDENSFISPSSSAASNVSKSLLLTNISNYIHPESGKITIDKMPRRLADLFKHVLIPEQLQRPLAFPAEHENIKQLIQWLDSKRLKLSPEKKKLLERLILKNFVEYCRAEQDHLLLCGAAEDYLDYRVYPVEIVKEIYQNVKEGEAAYNELRQLRNAEQKMSKAKTSSAVGFSKLLFGCTKQLEDLYMSEQEMLSCAANRAKNDNSLSYSSEYLKHLRELKTHLSDYCSSVGIIESKQTAIKDFLNEWKEMLNEQILIHEKRKECFATAKQRLAATVEEKRKMLAELKEQSQKLSEARIASTIKAHENTVALSKVKIRYNQLLDKMGRAQNSGDQIDVISEHLYKHYKELLSCPTCKVNPKNCALTKCYHLFCEDCITKMFKTRNRKCPECNTRVGPTDYHRVYF